MRKFARLAASALVATGLLAVAPASADAQTVACLLYTSPSPRDS